MIGVTDKMEYNSQKYRSVSAEETYRKLQPILGEMGITRLANITGLDQIGIPVFIAVRPNSKSMSLSQGKGVHAIDAKVSALMETIESYHGENIDLDVVEGSVSGLGGGNVCDYKNLPTCKDSRFSEDTKIKWVEAVNVLDTRKLYVPYQLANVDLTSANVEAPYFIQSSNGLASGNTYQEATNHAICELVERDAYSCWTLMRSEDRNSTKVDLGSIDSETGRRLIKMFEDANIHVGAWDLTSDTGVPAFLVRIISKEMPPYCQIRPASGFGCHPDKESALIRALTEAAQSRLTFISGARDDIRLAHYRSFTSESEYRRWHQSIVQAPTFVNYGDIPSHSVSDQRGVWKCLKDALSALGINQILAVDLSKEQFGISVSKVVIPGLEGGESYEHMEYGRRAGNIIRTFHDTKGALSA